MEICFATNNPHKLKEIRQLIGGRHTILSLKDIGCEEELPETHETIEENSLEKAGYVYKKYHIDCFADDTGLEIDALDGAPGVYSARYAGENPDFDDNMDKVLQEMGDTDNRGACFRTVITLILDGVVRQFEGTVDGAITRKKEGAEGFGYDPVFKPEGYDRTFAELSSEEKNKVSHRGQAVRKLAEFLNNQ